MTVSFLQVANYPDENCGICLEGLSSDVWAHGVHRFHGKCITIVANDNPACPLCRRVIDTTTLVARDELLEQQVDLTKKLSSASMLPFVGCYVLPMIIETGPYKDILHFAGFAFLGGATLLKMYSKSLQSQRG